MAATALAGCAAAEPDAAGRDPATPIREGPTIDAPHGVVVSVSPIASRIGCETLRRGGNAVDAAVATAFALAVVWPEAGNIGGGGFMMIHRDAPGPSPAAFVDYRETAPAAATRDTFASPTTKPSSHMLAGTPGTVRGLHLAHQRFGSGRASWESLVLPAAKLAADGFTVDAALASSLNAGLKDAGAFAEFRRVYGKPDGSPWAAGDRLALPDLARTLRGIAAGGPDAFYSGDTAKLTVDEMRRGGGMISADDLRQYEAKLREPVVGRFKGYTVYAPPPPSSGGVALIEMLNVLETFDLKPANRWSPATVHLMVEAMRRAYADRARHLGDPDFANVPVRQLTDPAYAKDLAATIDPAKASRSEDVAPWVKLANEEGSQTTHFSVVDANGMAVSNTFTLEQSFGGKIVVPGAGYLLNNELGDFNPRPGVTTRAGLIGTPPNEVRPGKRPLSSMTPVIVARDGRVVLVTGSPGGRTIINTVAQVVLNRLAFGMTLRDAVDAPRLHHAWFPDQIRVEAAYANQHGPTLAGLKAMGHSVDPATARRQGDAHSVEVDPATGMRTGVADRRIGGSAAGY